MKIIKQGRAGKRTFAKGQEWAGLGRAGQGRAGQGCCKNGSLRLQGRAGQEKNAILGERRH